MISTLIVEDDFRVAEVHRAFVERMPGFAVAGTVHTGAEALDLAESLRPDLVLLDLYLPDRSGLEVLRDLRAPGRPPLDVIAITAAKDVETLRAALQGGVTHYLVKPFQFSTFRAKLESYAAMRASLERSGEVDQGQVDRIVGLLRPESAEPRKGISSATLEIVSNAVRIASRDLSASEVAERSGVSRVTSRRYLEHLAQAGLVSVSMRYGTSGRPEHRYRWVRELEPTKTH